MIVPPVLDGLINFGTDGITIVLEMAAEVAVQRSGDMNSLSWQKTTLRAN